MDSEFGKFEHRAFSIEYPVDWVNVTRRIRRLRMIPLLVYAHRRKRTGLLGAIADLILWQMDAEFAIFSFSLEELKFKIRAETKLNADEIVFDYILSRFRLPKARVEMLGKRKEVVSGKRSYFITVNDSGRQYEFRLVLASPDVGVVLRSVAPLKILTDYKETFDKLVQSFKLKGSGADR